MVSRGPAGRLPGVTDPSLITSAAAGDEEAMATLIRELAPTVHAYLVGMLGDDEEAEGGMGETFVRVARAVERYETGTDPTSWVFSIARRVAGDIRPTPASAPGEAPPEGDTDEWAKRSLRSLPAELREVLVLKELLHWTPDRIALVVGVDQAEVSRRVLDAHAHLAEGMRARGDEGRSDAYGS